MRAGKDAPRIIAGKWRGRRLAVAPGETTRPTAARVREALFSMLIARIGGFEGLRVLDLFSGSGALGFEALSRGAAHATFVEADAAAFACLEANATMLNTQGQATLVHAKAEACRPAGGLSDLVLMDPPYRSGLAARALERLTSLGALAPGAWIAIETAADEPFEHDCVQVRRVIGAARLTLMRSV